MEDCCWENATNAKRVGRAHYVCPVCGVDCTLAWFLLKELEENESIIRLS